VSGTLSTLYKYSEASFHSRDVESVWVAEWFVLPKPEEKTFWTGLVLALQDGGIRLTMPAG